jgi:phage baseplate assembly protein W
MPRGIDTAHLRWPFRLTSGAEPALQLVEQDTLADVRQSVQLLMVTAPGSRPLAPEVGIEDYVFTSDGIDPELLAARLEEFEDRARVTVTVVPADGSGHRVVQVHVALADDAAQDSP